MSTSLHVYKDVQLPMVISFSVLIYRDRNIVCNYFYYVWLWSLFLPFFYQVLQSNDRSSPFYKYHATSCTS